MTARLSFLSLSSTVHCEEGRGEGRGRGGEARGAGEGGRGGTTLLSEKGAGDYPRVTKEKIRSRGRGERGGRRSLALYGETPASFPRFMGGLL